MARPQYSHSLDNWNTSWSRGHCLRNASAGSSCQYMWLLLKFTAFQYNSATVSTVERETTISKPQLRVVTPLCYRSSKSFPPVPIINSTKKRRSRHITQTQVSQSPILFHSSHLRIMIIRLAIRRSLRPSWNCIS